MLQNVEKVSPLITDEILGQVISFEKSVYGQLRHLSLNFIYCVTHFRTLLYISLITGGYKNGAYNDKP